MADWTPGERQYLAESWTDDWPKTLPVPCPDCSDEDAFDYLKVRDDEPQPVGALISRTEIEQLDVGPVRSVFVECKCSEEGGCGKEGPVPIPMTSSLDQ